jgi:hypothetical protein
VARRRVGYVSPIYDVDVDTVQFGYSFWLKIFQSEGQLTRQLSKLSDHEFSNLLTFHLLHLCSYNRPEVNLLTLLLTAMYEFRVGLKNINYLIGSIQVSTDDEELQCCLIKHFKECNLLSSTRLPAPIKALVNTSEVPRVA